MRVNYYIVDKDGVLCDADGTPVLITGALDTQAISLAFHEAHDDVATSDNINDKTTFAIAKDHAIDLGLICAYGDKYDSAKHKSLVFLSYRNIVNTLDIDTAELISRAIQLVLWQADHRYCSRCGMPTHVHQSEHAMMCKNCRHRAYPRVQPCVITAITRLCPNTQKKQILLALHHRHKETGMYGLIAGFIEAGESLEHAVHREVAEEVGLSVQNLRYISSQPWPYPTNLMLGFVADYAGGEIRLQANELADARFFDVDDLPLTPKVGTIAHTLIQHVIHL